MYAKIAILSRKGDRTRRSAPAVSIEAVAVAAALRSDQLCRALYLGTGRHQWQDAALRRVVERLAYGGGGESMLGELKAHRSPLLPLVLDLVDLGESLAWPRRRDADAA